MVVAAAADAVVVVVVAVAAAQEVVADAVAVGDGVAAGVAVEVVNGASCSSKLGVVVAEVVQHPPAYAAAGQGQDTDLLDENLDTCCSESGVGVGLLRALVTLRWVSRVRWGENTASLYTARVILR